jgi:predicted RNA methylase
MKKLLILSILLLSACNPFKDPIPAFKIDYAVKYCTNNEGLKFLVYDEFNPQAICNNGAVFNLPPSIKEIK